MMIRLVFRTICLFVIIDYVKGAKIGKQTSLSRVSRQVLPSCDEQICKDCRGSCDGCNKCPLCAILAKTCAEGKKKLVFEGEDVCAKCKYCKDGKEKCKTNCELGKSKSTCQHCIKNLWLKVKAGVRSVNIARMERRNVKQIV